MIGKYNDYNEFKTEMLSKYPLMDDNLCDYIWEASVNDVFIEDDIKLFEGNNKSIENLAEGMWNAQLEGTVINVIDKPRFTKIEIFDQDFNMITLVDWKKELDLSNVKSGMNILVQEACSYFDNYDNKLGLKAFSRTTIQII